MSLDRNCRIEGDIIIVEVLEQPLFKIRLSTCNTHSQILARVSFFLTLRQIDPVTLSRFIRMVCEYHHIPLPPLV